MVLLSDLEMNVKEAAKRIGLTERQIRNHIKAKNIKAIKVGKEWFVDTVSVEAFMSRYRLVEPINKIVPPSQDSDKKGEDEYAEVKKESKATTTEEQNSKSEGKEKSKKQTQQILNLNCYKLCVEAFADWSDSSTDPKLMDELKNATLINLGAGYYSYDLGLKVNFYRKARASIGSLLAILFSRKDWVEAHQKEIHFLEEKTLPALSALIRKMEKKVK